MYFALFLSVIVLIYSNNCFFELEFSFHKVNIDSLGFSSPSVGISFSSSFQPTPRPYKIAKTITIINKTTVSILQTNIFFLLFLD